MQPNHNLFVLYFFVGIGYPNFGNSRRAWQGTVRIQRLEGDFAFQLVLTETHKGPELKEVV